jgi:poly(beta-D-mannuronate) lyase
MFVGYEMFKCKSQVLHFTLAISLLASQSAMSFSAPAAQLKSPFVAARFPLKNNGKTSCKNAVPKAVVELELLSIYDQEDGSRSKIDPLRKKAYDAAIASTRVFSSDITKYSSNYVQSDGNRLEAAACVLAYLDTWAKADALSVMKTRQSALSATRILAGSALAYIQVREAVGILKFDTTHIESWFDRRAAAIIPVYTESKDLPSNKQNHRYWGGLAVASIGVAIGKSEYLNFGVDSYEVGVSQIQADGSLPFELKRKKRARDYHLHATAPLVMIAELASANGIDLYASHDGALHRLIDFGLRAMNDPAEIEELTSVRMEAFPKDGKFLRGDRLAWTDAYFARFPEKRASYMLNVARPMYSSNIGGRITVLYDTEFRN